MIYYGYKRNDLEYSASGGAAQAIAEWGIERKYIVYGVSYTDDYKSAEYRRVNNVKEANSFRGTKYIFPKINDTYKSIKYDLLSGQNVLLFGLPCFIASLKNRLKRDGICEEKLITVDLICHGPTSERVQEEYISYLERRFNGRIVDFTLRHKKYGWKKPYIYAKFDNGKEYLVSFYKSEFSTAFSIMTNGRCYACKNKGDNRMSDMTIGDFWGCTEEFSAYNEKGVSLLIPHTDKGMKVILLLKNMVLEETTEKYVIDYNPYYYKSVCKNIKYDSFKRNFEKKGLLYACWKEKSLFQRITYCIKRVLKII